MRKRKVEIITLWDGRKFVHDKLLQMNKKFQSRLRKALEDTGEVEVISASDIAMPIQKQKADMWRHLNRLDRVKRWFGDL